MNQSSRQLNFTYIFLLILITIISFSDSIHNNFINWDDVTYLEFYVKGKDFTFNGINQIFTTFTFSNYHPLTMILYALIIKLFGYNPLVFHLISLLIHILNAVLVYVFIKLLIINSSLHREQSTAKAFIVSVLFAIHPMHVESVVWASELKDMLYAFFYLSGLITYILYLNKSKSIYHIFTWGLFILSLLSKCAAVTFPLSLIIIEYYLSNNNRKLISLRSLLNKIPILTLSLFFGIINIFAQSESEAFLKNAS